MSGDRFRAENYLDLYGSRNATERTGCFVLDNYLAVCDCCGERTWHPHAAADQAFCLECCPWCAHIRR